MLQMSGGGEAPLLTDDPTKREGLARAMTRGIGRAAAQGASNSENRRYRTAKVTRAAQKLDRLRGAAENKSDRCDETLRLSPVSQRAIA
jgi:hypothetical protein